MDPEMEFLNGIISLEMVFLVILDINLKKTQVFCSIPFTDWYS